MTDDYPRIVGTDRGNTVVYRNRHLYSSRDPQSAVIRSVEEFQFPRFSIVFLPSPLLFYGVEQLLAKLTEDDHLLCVETDEHLMALSIENTAGVDLRSGSLTYVRTADPATLCEIVDRLGPWRFRRALLLPLTGGYGLDKATYDMLFAKVEQHIRQYWQNRMTQIHLAQLWVRNLIRNLGLLSMEMRCRHMVTDLPVLVAGAGESLEGTIPLVKRYRSRLFILAVDTALPVLSTEGITPDALVVVEAQFVNLYDFLPAGFGNFPVFCDLTSYPAVARRFDGRLLPFCSRFHEVRLFNRLASHRLLPQTVPPLGSVGVLAVHLALDMTRSEVFLSGLDFSYVPGKPHARGSASHLYSLLKTTRLSPPGLYADSIRRPLLRFPGKGGRSEVTDVVLLNYSKTLRAMIEKEERVTDLGLRGLVTAPKSVASMEEAERALLAASRKSAGTQGRRPSWTPPSEPSDRRLLVDRFLGAEIELHESFEKSALKWLTSNKDPAAEGDVLTTLAEVDHVFLHFPDTAPMPRLDESFITRCVVSSRRYTDELRRARKRLHPG